MSDKPFDPNPTHRNFYGRRHGKTLRRSQKGYLSEDLGPLRPAGITVQDNPDRNPVMPGAIFGDDRPIWLEVGFGGGEHMVHMAARYPEIGIIGCEPFINGVAMLLGKIRAAGVENVSVHPGDARDLMDVLPEGSIAKAFLNYPDPWPKTRHWDRRFMNPDNLAALARVMAPGAELRLATDIAEYARHAIRAAEIAGGFALQGGPLDWARPWPDWVTTRFEARARREGRGSQYLTFVRL